MMASWWRSHQEVQDTIENFGAELQADSQGEDLQQHAQNVAAILKEHHQWLLATLDNFKPPSATSKAALDKPSFTLGPEMLTITAERKATALEASARLNLDETQAYLLVHRCAETQQGYEGSEPAGQGLLEQVIEYYGAERQALLSTLRTLLNLYDGDNNQAGAAARVFPDADNRLIKDGLEAKLVEQVKRHFVTKPPGDLDPSSMSMWADEMAVEQSLLMSTLFVFYFSHPPRDSARLLELTEYFQEHVFLADEATADTWQSYATSDLSSVRHRAVLLVLVLMGLDKLPGTSKGGEACRIQWGYPFQSSSAVTHFDTVLLSLEDASPHVASLSLAWASSLMLLNTASDSGGSHLLAELPPERASYHIQRAEEGGVFEQMLETLREEEFLLMEPQVTAYKHVMKLVVSTSLRAFNLLSPVVDESNPRGQTVVDLLAALYSGDEYLALGFFDAPLDAPIKELAEALALFWPARSQRLLTLLTSLCQGPWTTENVFNFLYQQRTVAFLYSHPDGGPIHAREPLPLPAAPGLFVPPNTPGAVLVSADVSSDVSKSGGDVSLVAWECRHHAALVLLLTARHLAERFAQSVGGEKELAHLRSILVLLEAFVRPGGSPVATLILELNSSPLVVAGKRDGRIDPGLQIDPVGILAAICHFVGVARREISSVLLPPVVNILAAFAEICPGKVAGELAQVWLFETGGNTGRMERLQEVLEGGEYGTGEAKLTLAVLELVYRLAENGVHLQWAATVARHTIEETLPQIRGRRFSSQLLLWQVVGRALDVALAALSSPSIPDDSQSPLQTVAKAAFLSSANPDARNVLLSVVAVGARGLDAIAFSATAQVGELEAAQEAVAASLRLFTLLLEASHGDPCVNNFKALVFKDGHERILGALAACLRYGESESLRIAAANALRAMIARAAETGCPGGEFATGVVRSLGQKEAKRVQIALGEALPGLATASRVSDAVAKLLSAAGEWQPSMVAWAFLPPVDRGNSGRGGQEGVDKKEESNGARSGAMSALSELVKQSPDLVRRAPQAACHVLSLLLAVFRSCGPEATDSGLGLKDQLWPTLGNALQISTANLGSGRNPEDQNHAEMTWHFQVTSLVLTIASEQMWAVARRRRRGAEGELEGAGKGAWDLVARWEKTVGESPRALVMRLCRPPLEEDGLRDAVVLCRSAVAGLLASPPPRPDATLSDALQKVRRALEAHPTFDRLARDPVYSSASFPDTLILTDLAAHLNGVLAGRPIPTGPFFELASHTDHLRLESLLMRRATSSLSLLASSPDLLSSSSELLTCPFPEGPFDVVGAARAVGPDAGESVREALDAIGRWNDAERGARAHLQLGRAFGVAIGMAAAIKTPGDELWPSSEVSASVTELCSAIGSSVSQSAAATSSVHVTLLAGLLASLVSASPPDNLRQITPLVVETTAIMLQSQKGRSSPWLGSTPAKTLLQSALICLNPVGFSASSSTALAIRGDERRDTLSESDHKLSDAIPSFCRAVIAPEERQLVCVILSQLVGRLPVDSWEGRVTQCLPFSELVRSLPSTSAGHLPAVLELLQALVQRSGEVAGRLVEAGLVQALTSLGQSHPPPSPRGPFSLTWDVTNPNPDPVWSLTLSFLAALASSVPPRHQIQQRLEGVIANLGPAILQSLTPPNPDPTARPRTSMSSVRAALHSAQLLTRLHQPGTFLAALLGPRFVHDVDRAVNQTLTFIARQGLSGGESKKGGVRVGCLLETREERTLARMESRLSPENSAKGWFGVTSAWAKGESANGAHSHSLPQIADVTLASWNVHGAKPPAETPTGQKGTGEQLNAYPMRPGASAMRPGPSAYTEALAGDVYSLAEALARFVALRVGETLIGHVAGHVAASGGPPPPELPTSETLHALQDQCLLLAPALSLLPSARGSILALLDHAFLLESAVNQLFGSHTSKLRADSAAKHVKTAIDALRQQGSSGSDTAAAIQAAARQQYRQSIESL